jgi:hypothetical protein
MGGYELAFWIAVAIIAALIAGICWPSKSEYPPEHPDRWCDMECHSYGGHRYLDVDYLP